MIHWVSLNSEHVEDSRLLLEQRCVKVSKAQLYWRYWSLSSDECSSSGRSELYPLLSVSKINAVYMLSLLWVRSGMSNMHVCVVYPIRTQDSVELGVRSTLVAAYVLCYEFWMVYEVCVHFSLWVAIPITVSKEVAHPLHSGSYSHD